MAAPVAAAAAIANIIGRPRQGVAVLPYRLSHNYKLFLVNNTMTHSATSMLVFHMFRSVAVDWGITLPFEDARFNAGAAAAAPLTDADFGSQIDLPAAGGVAVGAPAVANLVAFGVNYPAAAADTMISLTTWQHLTASIPSSSVHTFELSAAHQAAALSERNVESYGKMARIEFNATPVIRVLNYLVGVLPALDSNASTHAHANTVDWLKYRLTATSTPALVDKCVSTIGQRHLAAGVAGNPNAMFTLGANTTQVLVAAQAAPYTKALHDAIPRPLVAITDIFLEVYQIHPPQWFQGASARNALTPLAINYWRTAIAEHRRLVGAGGVPIAGFANIAALVANAVTQIPASILA